MTTRLCWAAYPCSPFTSNGKQIGSQTRRPSRRHAHYSLRAIRFVAALDEAKASDSVGASAHGLSLLRPTRPNSAQSLTVTNGAGDGSRKEADEAQGQVRLQDLRIGCIYKGKVSVIESYGVFVDIGADTDGFIHISRLGRSFVRRVEDVVKVGDDVRIQIIDVDLNTGSISLLLRSEEDSDENASLCPLTLPEQEVVNRAAARRANKVHSSLPRRVMSLETRRQLKAYRRAVLAERQAIQLHQVRSRARTSDDLNEADKVGKGNC